MNASSGRSSPRPAFLLVALLCALTTCAAVAVAAVRAQPAAAHAPHPTGATIVSDGLALQIDGLRPADAAVRAAGRFNPPPPPGYEYALVFVSAECGALLCRLTPQQFTLRDRTGASFEPRQRSVDDPLVAVTLPRGESVARRALVFEVNIGAEGLRLVHRAGLLFGTETIFAVP